MTRCRFLLIGAVLATVAGCSHSDPPEFHSNMPEMVNNQIIPAHRQSIADILEAMFGTPDEPFVLPETGLNLQHVKLASGPVFSDKQGLGHGLYREHCAHCHGITGDGHGPTALFLNPYPRDYRPGVFKFKSTYNAAQPTTEDLYRVLMHGVPGTAMPSFALLPPAEVEALIEYVKYLSMRGQMETALIRYVADELDYDPVAGTGEPLDPATNEDQRSMIMEELLPYVVEGWQDAPDNIIYPEPDELPSDDRSPAEIAASVAQGRELFYGAKANCIKCHGPTGLGDGQTDDYNNWNKDVVAFEEETKSLSSQIEQLDDQMGEMQGEDRAAARERRNSLVHQLAERQQVQEMLFPPRNAIPRNLRQGMYRGGRRPLDIYRKVYTGIAGTPMPGGGPATPGATGTLTEEEMWQIVDYVRSLPYEQVSMPRKLRINYDVLN